MAFVDACWFTAGSSGTADFADGTALSAFRNMAAAGAVNGEVYSYRAESLDRTQWEMGYGAYSSGGNTLARTVTASSAGGTTKVDFSAAPIVSLQPLARDMANLPLAGGTMTGPIGFTHQTSPANPGSGVLAVFAKSDDKLYTRTSAGVETEIGAGGAGGYFNGITNGDGIVNQRSSSYTTVADDTYWCDRHYVLTQTAAITPTVINDVADGVPRMMRLSQSQATAQRMGNAQILEGAWSKRYRGKTVTLGGKLRTSDTRTVRFAVLEWTGTENAVTSDVVNSWTSSTFTAGNFFLASNLVVAAVGSLALSANTLTDWALPATISSSANNIIVFYWTDATAAQNVTMDMRWWFVEGEATEADGAFAARPEQQELDLCYRFVERLEKTSGDVAFNVGYADSSSQLYAPWVFRVQKWTTPTIAGSATASDFGALIKAGGFNGTFEFGGSSQVGESACRILINGGSGLTAGEAVIAYLRQVGAFIEAVCNL